MVVVRHYDTLLFNKSIFDAMVPNTVLVLSSIHINKVDSHYLQLWKLYALLSWNLITWHPPLQSCFVWVKLYPGYCSTYAHWKRWNLFSLTFLSVYRSLSLFFSLRPHFLWFLFFDGWLENNVDRIRKSTKNIEMT